MKLPRKLKKGLKSTLLSTIDSNWKSKELKIQRIGTPHRFGRNEVTFKGKTIKSYTLGV